MELEVHWRGSQPELVGRLYQNAQGQIFFEYADSWRRGSRELSPFYLPNSTRGAVRTSTPAMSELHGLFQDALPDWWGERLMRRHFEQQGIPWNRVTALQKLACQGERKLGALAYRPATDPSDFNEELRTGIEQLVEAARKAVRGEPSEVLQALIRSGMSPGGAQPKALLAISDESGELRLHETVASGFRHWLVKFDLEPSLQEGRIEKTYSELAKLAGIEVPATRLLETADSAHFAIERFDRTADGQRQHFHSYAGLTQTALREGLEYGDLLDVTRALTQDQRVVAQVFRRAVFNVIAGNDDDHGKNHAFLMDQAGAWRLAPAYDLTRTSYPLASGFRAARVNGKAAGIKRKDFQQLARDHDLERADAIIDEVTDALHHWPELADEWGIFAANAATTADHHQLDF